jgi:hypothetical protein
VPTSLADYVYVGGYTTQTVQKRRKGELNETDSNYPGERPGPALQLH